MNCIQAQPGFTVPNVWRSQKRMFLQCSIPSLKPPAASFKFTTGLSINRCARFENTTMVLATSSSRYRYCPLVCSFGGKDSLEDGKKASPWNAIEKAMGSFKKEQSIENVLREQMEKQEFYGGSGGNGPGGGGGGGDGLGDSEDEGFSGILDETVQVVLATLGFIFLYIYIINGEEINVLIKDLLRFVFTGQKSFRLKRLTDQWGSYLRSLNKKKEVDPYWLERAIITTPTWWDGPEKYKRILRAYMASKYDQDQ